MVCEAQSVIHSDEHNGFCHLPTLGEHPWVLPGQGRRVSDPKVHRVGLLRLLLRDTSLHCHSSDVITRDSGRRGDSPAPGVPLGRAKGEQCWNCHCTTGQNRARGGS